MDSRRDKLLLMLLCVTPGLWVLALLGIFGSLIDFVGPVRILVLSVLTAIFCFLLRPILIHVVFAQGGKDADSRGELERLVVVKSEGSLLERTLLARESARKNRTRGVTNRPALAEAPECGDTPAHLVKEKRRGAWSIVTPDSSDCPQASDQVAEG